MSGGTQCPRCAERYYTKRRCNHCGSVACGRCHPQGQCQVCKKGQMRPL